MHFDFTNHTDAQLESRAAEILVEMTKDGANLEELRNEAQAIQTERDARAAEAKRREIRAAVANGAGTVVARAPQEQRREERNYDAASPEYRSAWLKELARDDRGNYRLGAPTTEERAAFTHTTANSGNVVPQVLMNRIIDLMDSRAPIYADSYKTYMTQGFGVPRRNSITAGDSSGVSEGTANANDEHNDYGLLPLDGVEIKKHVVLSRKMKFKSIDAFEAWLVKELGERQTVAKERLCIARMKGSAPEGGTAVADAAIAAANKNNAVARTDAGIRGMFALVKGAEKTIYANSNTIWNILAGIEDGGGHRLFIPSGMDDPTVAGRVYGAKVKEDPQLADDEFYLIAKDNLWTNEYDELEIFSTVEAKTANEIKTAYSLTDAGCADPKGAAYGKFAAAT